MIPWKVWKAGAYALVWNCNIRICFVHKVCDIVYSSTFVSSHLNYLQKACKSVQIYSTKLMVKHALIAGQLCDPPLGCIIQVNAKRLAEKRSIYIPSPAAAGCGIWSETSVLVWTYLMGCLSVFTMCFIFWLVLDMQLRHWEQHRDFCDFRSLYWSWNITWRSFLQLWKCRNLFAG